MFRHRASSYRRNLLIASLAAIAVFALTRELVKLWIDPTSLLGWAIALMLGVGSAALVLYLETGSLFFSRPSQKPLLDPTKYLARVMRSLELVTDPVQLQNTIAAHISEIIDAPAVALFLRDPDEERFALGKQIGYQDSEVGQLVFERPGRLVGWLKTNQTALWVHRDREIVEYLDQYERQILKQLDVDLCLPFSAMNRLVGFAFVRTRSETSVADEGFLRRFCFQIGLALENALLYQQQRVRLRRLYRAERLATTGQLAAGAAHEIRNPLAAISSSIQYLSEEFPPDHRKREIVDGLLEEVDRINRIIEGLLSFARPAQPKKERISLRGLLEQTILLARSTAKKSGVEVESDFSAGDDRIEADPAQLRQVFLNIIMNSIQAMPRGGRLRIKFSRSERKLFATPGGHRFRIEFTDTGVGMSPEQLERAFDPFYSTKPEGTGLGLPISYSIVRSHGGEMDIESQPGRGTTVRVEL